MTAPVRARSRAPWIALPLAALMVFGAAPAYADEAPAPTEAPVTVVDAAPVEAPASVVVEAPAPVVEVPAPAPVEVAVAEPSVVDETIDDAPAEASAARVAEAAPAAAAAAADVADPQLTLTPSTVNPAVANTITVSGTGYVGPGAANGVYVNIGTASHWQPGQIPGSGGWVVSKYVPAALVSGGAFTTTLTVPAAALSAGTSYGVATFAAHELSITNRSLDAWKAIAVEVPAPVANPQLTVTPTTLNPAVANTITVSGTGYVGPGAAGGVYVNLGAQTHWQPGQVPSGSGWVVSEWIRANGLTNGAFTIELTIPADTLTAGTSYGIATFATGRLSQTDRTLDAWKAVTVQTPAPVANPQLTVTPTTALDPTIANTITVSGTGYVGPGAANGVYVNLGPQAHWQPGQVPGSTGWIVAKYVPAALVRDGAFTTTLTIPAGSLTVGTSYGVATFAAHELSITNRTLDAWKVVTVQTPAPVANPQLTVTPATLNPAIENVVTVSGTGYVGPGAVNGVYVNLGAATGWQPGQMPGSGGWVKSAYVPAARIVDGAFTATLVIPAGALTAGTEYGVATFAAHELSITDRTLDAWRAVTITGTGTGTPGTPGNPGTPGTPGNPGTAAPRLSVSPSTIDPSVATVVTVSGSGYAGAGAANGVYVSIGSASTWQPGQTPTQGGWIVSSWVQPGSLRNGSFSTQLTIPAGALKIGGSYGVATFAAHELSLSNRSLDAWRALTIGTAGSSGSAATAPRTAADEAPADEGADVTSTTVTQGGEVTATASGFEPNETGILVVVYSDPVVLDNDARADAAGVVTWTGRLPQDLVGTHTLTFQGSQNVGVPIEITERAALGCTVEGALLEWGFKESFRSYISGTIANGEWTTSGDAGYETPAFSWSDGSGSRDEATGTVLVGFEGSVRFIGHEGALDTTISNPRIEVGDDSAILILDVEGTTQDGRELVRVGVEFAELDLTGIEPASGDGIIELADIPAVLTTTGAEVFGTYPAGEALDPITLVLPAGDCAEGAVDADDPVAAPVEQAGSSLPSWIIWAVVAALLALIAIVAVVLVRRRRA